MSTARLPEEQPLSPGAVGPAPTDARDSILKEVRLFRTEEEIRKYQKQRVRKKAMIIYVVILLLVPALVFGGWIVFAALIPFWFAFRWFAKRYSVRRRDPKLERIFISRLRHFDSRCSHKVFAVSGFMTETDFPQSAWKGMYKVMPLDAVDVLPLVWESQTLADGIENFAPAKMRADKTGRTMAAVLAAAIARRDELVCECTHGMAAPDDEGTAASNGQQEAALAVPPTLDAGHCQRLEDGDAPVGSKRDGIGGAAATHPTVPADAIAVPITHVPSPSPAGAPPSAPMTANYEETQPPTIVHVNAPRDVTSAGVKEVGAGVGVASIGMGIGCPSTSLLNTSGSKDSTRIRRDKKCTGDTISVNTRVARHVHCPTCGLPRKSKYVLARDILAGGRKGDPACFSAVGHSLGCRVILEMLAEMGRKGLEGAIYQAVLMGGALRVREEDEAKWQLARRAVSHQFTNCYSRHDGTLSKLYTCQNMACCHGEKIPTAGLHPVPYKGLRISNIDVSEEITSHVHYKGNMHRFWNRVGFECMAPWMVPA